MPLYHLSLGRTREIVVAARENRDPAIRAAIIDLIDEGKALGSISRHAADAQTRLRALRDAESKDGGPETGLPPTH